MEHALATRGARPRTGLARARRTRPGFANQAAGRDITKELAGIVDEIEVTLFGVTARSSTTSWRIRKVGNEGWEQMRDFVRCSVAAGIETVCEFVATPGFEPEPCREFARDLGARYDIRMYRS